MKKQLEKKIKNVEEKDSTNATFLMMEKSFERRRIVVVTTKKKIFIKMSLERLHNWKANAHINVFDVVDTNITKSLSLLLPPNTYKFS